MSLVLSIDLGTSGCRSAVVDESLSILACAKTEYELIVKSESAIEQDAETWWQAVCRTAGEAVAASDGNAIRAVSISSQGISVVPVDRDGNPLYHALSWLDTRAGAELDRLLGEFGRDGLRRRTGLLASPLYSAAKLMWMRTHLAGIMDSAAAVLLPMDFILMRLTGKIATNHTMANGTMLYNVTREEWDDELLDYVGLAKEKLPPIHKAGFDLGPLLPEVAAQ